MYEIIVKTRLERTVLVSTFLFAIVCAFIPISEVMKVLKPVNHILWLFIPSTIFYLFVLLIKPGKREIVNAVPVYLRIMVIQN